MIPLVKHPHPPTISLIHVDLHLHYIRYICTYGEEILNPSKQLIEKSVSERAMEEMGEVVSIPATPRNVGRATPPISAPPSNLHSPSLTRSPLLQSGPRTPRTPRTPRFITPLASPMRKAIVSMKGYLEDMGHLTKLDPQDAWLPITESRNGNAFYAAFHTLTAGIGAQALVLPVAFTFLGW